MKGIVEVLRTENAGVVIKIGIPKEAISAFVNNRVYVNSGISFSCDDSYEEIFRKYLEA